MQIPTVSFEFHFMLVVVKPNAGGAVQRHCHPPHRDEDAEGMRIQHAYHNKDGAAYLDVKG